MIIKYLCISSIILIFESQISSQAHATRTKSNLRGSINVPAAFLKGSRSKLVIYRDIKNHTDHKPTLQQRISAVRPLKHQQTWPRIPSLYLEPPKILKHHRRKNSKKLSPKKKPKKEDSNPPDKKATEGRNPQEIRPAYIRDHAPEQKQEQLETSDTEVKEEKNSEENSEDKDSVHFHVHGHQGPDSYIFGFDTGKGRNRQFRLEERHENGTVTGHYGYYDARGKLRKVNYSSNPSEGYEEASPNSYSEGQ